MINFILEKNLKELNTFGIDIKAYTFAIFTNRYDLKTLFEYCNRNSIKWYILGGGSNILFTEDYMGMIIKAGPGKIRILEKLSDRVIVTADAGVEWDEFVDFCVKNRLYGAENLSGIPGTVGASPVQNIGAYGVEVKDIIREVEFFNTENNQFGTIDSKECKFGYRQSIFKNELKGKSVVTSVIFELSTKPKFNLEYGNLKMEVEKMGKPTLETVRNAVLNIRNAKLPDPKVLGNSGSFFKNPVVSAEKAHALKLTYPDMTTYEVRGGVKLAAGWLIEKAGWKGFRRDDAGVHESQALVLVNYGSATGKEIRRLAHDIIADIQDKFGVTLDMEVNIL